MKCNKCGEQVYGSLSSHRCKRPDSSNADRRRNDDDDIVSTVVDAVVSVASDSSSDASE